ncbi:MAG: hypothetical protein JWL70_1116 [Acidimicrobiia bacterium]|nr:hypothetical protein [Acidimicrobiia bacterium]
MQVGQVAASERHGYGRPAAESRSSERYETIGRLAPRQPALAMASVIVSGYIAVCLVFAGLGLVVTHRWGALTRWDEHANRWLAGNRTSAGDRWTGDVTKLADTVGVLAVLLVAVLVLILVRHRWDALLLLVAMGLELATFLTINRIVERPRPDVARLGTSPSTSSFPSGHTAATAAVYGGLALILSARFRSRIVSALCWTFVLLLTAMIGFGRVYRGMHHPSDVVAGALIGLLVLAVAVIALHVGQMAVAQRRPRDAQGTPEPVAESSEG